jgi:hypothetical protein
LYYLALARRSSYTITTIQVGFLLLLLVNGLLFLMIAIIDGRGWTMESPRQQIYHHGPDLKQPNQNGFKGIVLFNVLNDGVAANNKSLMIEVPTAAGRSIPSSPPTRPPPHGRTMAIPNKTAEAIIRALFNGEKLAASQLLKPGLDGEKISSLHRRLVALVMR